METSPEMMASKDKREMEETTRKIEGNPDEKFVPDDNPISAFSKVTDLVRLDPADYVRYKCAHGNIPIKFDTKQPEDGEGMFSTWLTIMVGGSRYTVIGVGQTKKESEDTAARNARHIQLV